MARPTLGRDPSDKSKPLNRRQKIAAMMLATGRTVASVAKEPEVGCCPDTIRKWMDDPEFMKLLYAEQDNALTEFRHRLNAAYINSAWKAVRVLREQMEGGNDAYVRQNAAREMLNKFHQVMDKEEQKAVEIHFSNMPTIGSPKPDDNVPPPEPAVDINRLINSGKENE